MQNNYALMLHKSLVLFRDFCHDMEILPSYTPIFLVDVKGRVAERRFVLTQKDFSSIFSIVSEEDAQGLSRLMKFSDVFVLEASFGEGKDFIVVSKDKYGFSRCVVVSYSDKNCTKLHEYFEKLSCYKDYLDSFASLSFDNHVTTPVLRIFKSRMSGALELIRLSEKETQARTLAFPLKVAIEKLSAFALSVKETAECCIEIDDVSQVVAVKTSENFFKLTASLLGLLIRQTNSGRITVSTHQEKDEDFVYINFRTKSANFENEIYRDSLIRAFRRSGIDAFTSQSDGEINFCIRTECLRETGIIVSDVERIMLEIDSIMADTSLSDMYFMTADI